MRNFEGESLLKLGYSLVQDAYFVMVFSSCVLIANTLDPDSCCVDWMLDTGGNCSLKKGTEDLQDQGW